MPSGNNSQAGCETPHIINMEDRMETIKIEISEQNNYSRISEQDMRTTMYSGTMEEMTMERVYEIMDGLKDAATERRGYSGMGAGAYIVITIDNEEYTTTDVDEVLEIMGDAIPVGSRRAAFKFKAHQQKKTVWNGNNWEAASIMFINAFLEETK
jgi:hypothetical protein